MSSSRPQRLHRRLALRLALGVGVVLAGLFVAIDWRVDHELFRRFDASLAARADAVAAFLGANVDGAGDIAQWMPEFREEGHTDFFQAWDGHGQVVARSASSQDIDLAPPPTAPGARHLWYDLPLPDGHRGRAAARDYVLPDSDARRALRVVVAEEREQIDALERSVHVTLGGGVLLALLLVVAITGWSLAHELRPLDRLAHRVADIDLHAPAPRLADPGLPAELQPVARKIEDMVAALMQILARERRFAQDLAHELRTPVAELRAIAETGLLQREPERLRDALGELARLGGDMERTVEALLTLARAEAGLAAPQVEPMDLGALLATLPKRHAVDIAARSLVVDVAGDRECWVLADAAIVERLLASLFANAVEHAPSGAHVQLDLQQEGGIARVCLCNPAPQLRDADLPQLGTRFFRREGERGDGREHHAGLGLALAKALARAHALDLDFALHDGVLNLTLSGLPLLPVASDAAS
jgi:signal transduction histidine kinase